MKKIIGLLMVTAAAVGIVPYALSLGGPLLPPGVSAGDWIALSDRAGFVVTNGEALIGSTSSVGVAKGYFMLRRGDVWLRVDSTPDYGGTNPER
jgi:hypothetical protein